MRTPSDPRRWPVAVGLACVLVLAAPFVLPRAWLPFQAAGRRRPGDGPEAGARRWLVLQPPPEIEVVPPTAAPPDPPPPRPDPADPAWWRGGFVVAGRDDPSLFAPPTAAAADTVALVLAALGLGADLLSRTRPDSVLAARLALLRAEDAFAYDELKPLLLRMGRAEAYADILARAADMYDEPLAQEIRVPD